MSTSTTAEVLQRWFADHVPAAWLAAPPEVSADDDEILVICPLPAADDEDEVTAATAVAEFRAATKEQRMAVARKAEGVFRRQVSWGARRGQVRQLFTTVSVPVMTRLRLPERALLDTLVEAGVARSRSEALAWCARLVGTHEADWVAQLREALVDVQRLRREGPRSA